MVEIVSTVGCIVNTIDLVQSTTTALEAACSRVSSESQEPLDVRVKLLLFELRTATSKLLEWQKIWSPRDLKSEASFLLLWGQAGQREIRARLDNIQDPAYTILKLAEALEAAIQLNKMEAGNTLGRNWLRWLFSLPFLRDSSDTIRDGLNVSIVELISSVDRLLESTDTHFRSMHASTESEHPQSCQLMHVLGSRTISTAIYTEWQRSNVVLLLDLDLLNNEEDTDKFPDIFDWRDLSLVYHFVLLSNALDTGGFSATDIRLESAPKLETFDQDSEAQPPLTISSLLPVLQQSTGLSPEKVQGDGMKTFTIEVADTAFISTLSESYRHDPVFLKTTCGTNLNPTTCGPPISEKISLAYRVAESSLFLIGTPWLTHLSYNTIVHTGKSGVDRSYSIRVDCAGMQDATVSHLPNIERHHVHRIGLVLVDIAVGGLFEYKEAGNGRLSSTTVEWLEVNMGQTYANACQHCFMIGKGHDCPLEDHGLDTQNSTTATLTAFYSKVFLRLRDCLHDLP